MNYADTTQLRGYFFGNMYLSSIQQGIQAAHVVTKLFCKYPTNMYGEEFFLMHNYGNDGCTKILLNGGYQSNLADIFTIFSHIAPTLGLPFTKFHEENVSLNGALTSVGIVVPAEVYDFPAPDVNLVDSLHRKMLLPVLTESEARFADFLVKREAVVNATSTPQGVMDALARCGSFTDEELFFLLNRTLKSARLAS